jgi:hypothetical protein
MILDVDCLTMLQRPQARALKANGPTIFNINIGRQSKSLSMLSINALGMIHGLPLISILLEYIRVFPHRRL